MLRTVLAAALAVALSSEAASPGKPSVTVVVRGSPAAAEQARAALPPSDELPVELRTAELPNTASVPSRELALDEALAEARKAYVDAEFSRCLERVSDDAALVRALGEGNRLAAARLLLWRTACLVGMNRQAPAIQAAQRMGALGLDTPPDVARTTPEVEAVIARALKEQAHARLYPVRISALAPGGTAAIDGRDAACTLPCTIELPEGLHAVRVQADGIVPLVRELHVLAPGLQVELEPVPAPPALAAQQWTTRYAASAEVDGAASLRLLATAVRAPRLMLLTAEEEAQGTRLRGVLAVDGAVSARGERLAPSRQALSPAVSGLLTDLLVRGKVVERAPALHERPAFWAAVGATAAAAGLATFFLVRSRTVRTEVAF